MITWLMARLEHLPDAIFEHAELVGRDSAAFVGMRRDRLLRRCPTDDDAVLYRDGVRHCVVTDAEDRLWAFDDEDVETPWAEVDPQDLVWWGFDVGVWCRQFAHHHQLAGIPSATPMARLHHIGELDRRTGVSLVLANSQKRLDEVLDALPRLVPGYLQRHVIICPTYRPALNSLMANARPGIAFANLADDGLTTLPDLSECVQRLAGAQTMAIDTTLTPADEAIAAAWGLKTRVRIDFSGMRPSVKRNEVFVDGVRLELQDNLLRGFLRIALALFEAEEGWLLKSALEREGTTDEVEWIAFPPDFENWLGRLRIRLQGALKGDAGRSLLEASGDGRIRLSTPPELVMVNCQVLARHPDSAISSMAVRLGIVQGNRRSR